MPDRKRNIHYCNRCGKEMEYAEKSMIYAYKVREDEYLRFKNLIPRKTKAINVCDNCRKYFEDMMENDKIEMEG